MSKEIIEIILIGSILGLTAGISPGPLMALVLTQTLKHNRSEGIKIAVSPLITDLPIILITLFIFSQLSEFNVILGIISLCGGIFIAYLGYESVKSQGMATEPQTWKSDSLKKGIITNFLSPHPYLFWTTIGAPYVFKALDINILAAVIFFTTFYVLLIGSKVFIAIIVDRSKGFLGSKTYLIIIKLLGIILFGFSLLFIYDGLKHLGFI
jgi:threonine/homoserine/homoserine lactone efflux protein